VIKFSMLHEIESGTLCNPERRRCALHPATEASATENNFFLVSIDDLRAVNFEGSGSHIRLSDRRRRRRRWWGKRGTVDIVDVHAEMTHPRGCSGGSCDEVK
jgi:hypothetical protein